MTHAEKTRHSGSKVTRPRSWGLNPRGLAPKPMLPTLTPQLSTPELQSSPCRSPARSHVSAQKSPEAGECG